MRAYPYKIDSLPPKITWGLQKRKIWYYGEKGNRHITDGVFISRVSEKILNNNPEINTNGSFYGILSEIITPDLTLYNPALIISVIELESATYPYVLVCTMDTYGMVVPRFYPKDYVNLLWSLNTCSHILCGGIDYHDYLLFFEGAECVGILSPVAFSPFSMKYVTYHQHFIELIANAYEIPVSEVQVSPIENFKCTLRG